MKHVLPAKRRIVNYAGALVLPYLLLAIPLWLNKWDFFIILATGTGISLGTLCVFREFKWWVGLLIAVAYVPFMIWSLFYFALAWVGFFYGLAL